LGQQGKVRDDRGVRCNDEGDAGQPETIQLHKRRLFGLEDLGTCEVYDHKHERAERSSQRAIFRRCEGHETDSSDAAEFDYRQCAHYGIGKSDGRDFDSRAGANVYGFGPEFSESVGDVVIESTRWHDLIQRHLYGADGDYNGSNSCHNRDHGCYP